MEMKDEYEDPGIPPMPEESQSYYDMTPELREQRAFLHYCEKLERDKVTDW
jgi:hypothetical protein